LRSCHNGCQRRSGELGTTRQTTPTTGHFFADPDHFGTLHAWERNRYLRRLEALAPGSQKVRSTVFLFISLTMQALLILLLQNEQKGFYPRISWHAVYAGLRGNCQHAGSVARSVVRSLTLELPVSRGYAEVGCQWAADVVHRSESLYESIARAVREVLVRLYGTRYLSLPHSRAFRLLYTRPKLHLEHDTLVNPHTMDVFSVCRPGNLSMPAGAPRTAAHTPAA
jgi:hypothetical protein